MSRSTRSETSSTSQDDDILEVTQVQPSNKQEEERRFARQRLHSRTILLPLSSRELSNNIHSTFSRVHQREAILNDEMKFMADFDPDNSVRKLKKSRRRFYQDGRPIITADEFEICDCLEPKCPGCHLPCKSCGDSRCGQECRVNRRWLYESVEVEGRNKTLKHPHTENMYSYGVYDV